MSLRLWRERCMKKIGKLIKILNNDHFSLEEKAEELKSDGEFLVLAGEKLLEEED